MRDQLQVRAKLIATCASLISCVPPKNSLGRWKAQQRKGKTDPGSGRRHLNAATCEQLLGSPQLFWATLLENTQLRFWERSTGRMIDIRHTTAFETFFERERLLLGTFVTINQIVIHSNNVYFEFLLLFIANLTKYDLHSFSIL